MHRYIILADDIYTLDSREERQHAAAHMREAGVDRLPVYRGGPESAQVPEGRDLMSDGSFDNS